MRLFNAAILTLAISCCAFGQTYTINTFAGGGLPVNIPGTSASLSFPNSVAVDGAGNVFFVDGLNIVLRWDAATGVLTAVAGTGVPGFSGDNGPATSAQLSYPSGVALDAAGNLYIADTGNARIRKVSNGLVATVVGGGSSVGENVPATSAALGIPIAVAVDASGNLYLADYSSNCVRKVSNGVIATVAGNGTAGYSGDNGPATSAQLHFSNDFIAGVAVDSSGNLYIGDSANHRIRKVSNGVITTVAGNGVAGYNGDNIAATSAQLWYPGGVAVDAAGNLYVADSHNNRIRKVSNGVIATLAGGGFALGDNGPAASAQLYYPYGVALDSAGALYIADRNNNRIRKVSNGVITTLAGGGSALGDSGPAAGAQLSRPYSVAVESAGGVYIADTWNHRIRKVSNGLITTVAGTGEPGFSGDNGPAAGAQLYLPTGVAVDGAGNLYIADDVNGRIRKVSNGLISTVAGGGSSSGDNGPATSAQLGRPSGVAVDSAGNLYIADTWNDRIRKVSNGLISTVAGNGTLGFGGDNGPAIGAQLHFYLDAAAIAVDSAGNLYIADSGNNRIRKVSNGVITTVAGNGTAGFSGDNGPATGAQLSSPVGIAVDSAGNLFIGDSNSNRIRRVSNGVIATVAGNGAQQGFSGDSGPATSAQLGYPMGIAVDAAGNLYVADSNNNRIRVLTPSGPSCSASVTPLAVSVPISGGLFTVTIQTGSSCAWAIQSLPSWITFSGNAVQTGTGSVTLTALANPGLGRTADISIAGASVKVNQEGSGTPLVITTPSTLPSGFIGGGYSQPLAASGGAPPYTWMLSGNMPPGLKLSSVGVIAGTPTTAGAYSFTVQVVDSASATASQQFNLTIVAAGPLSRAGVISQLAAGGGWDTTIWLVNRSAAPVAARIIFHGDDGGPLSLPLTVTQPAASQQLTAATLDNVIAPNTTLVVAMGGSASVVQGWADVLSSGALSGFAVFRDGGASEAAVPLQSQIGTSISLPFDNTGGYSTGIAIVNLAGSPANITATVWDQNGNLLVSQSVALAITDPAGNGHGAFMLPSRLPVTAGIRGIVQFQGNPGSPFASGGALTGLGLKTDPNGLFTSMPTIVP